MAASDSFKVITLDDVVIQMNTKISWVNEALGIPPPCTRILLDRYKWDGEALMNAYFTLGDELFFRNARIINPLEHDNYLLPNTLALCSICLESTEITGLQCGHQFCHNCWRMYLTTKINNGVHTIPCADSRCDILVVDEIVKNLVIDPVVISKYDRLIYDSFIMRNKSLHWCTSPGCNHIIDRMSECIYAKCKCGNQFCCDCSEEMHAPISCQLLVKWKSDDSTTNFYLSVNTKPCPHCNSNIEKNGGCPHMVCTNCRHEFCWKCLKPWKSHNPEFLCRTAAESQEISKTRSLVQRLKYCFDRYIYNRHALKDEKDRFGSIWEEFQYKWDLNQGIDVLYDCRRFLMYSYALIYNLIEENSVYILESNLDDLEAKVDKLSMYLENYISIRGDETFSETESDIRTKIVNSVSHCKMLREKWLNEIEQGNEEKSWKYRE